MSQLATTDLQSPAEKHGEGQARGDLSAEEVGRESDTDFRLNLSVLQSTVRVWRDAGTGRAT